MELKVKDFASMQGVSDSIIYRHIRQHKEALGDRVIKRGNATWLTEEGQEYIRGLMNQQPVVVGSAFQQEEIETLRKQVDLLKDKLIDAHERLDAAKTLLEERKDQQLALEAAKKEKEILEGFIQDAKAEIAERTSEASEARQEAQSAREELKRVAEEAEASEAQKKALEEQLEALRRMNPLKRMFWRG